eukprot:gene9416-biopygen5880
MSPHSSKFRAPVVRIAIPIIIMLYTGDHNEVDDRHGNAAGGEGRGHADDGPPVTDDRLNTFDTTPPYGTSSRKNRARGSRQAGYLSASSVWVM